MHDADEADAPPAGVRARLSQYWRTEVRVPYVLPLLFGVAANYIFVEIALQAALFWVIAVPYVIASLIVAVRSLRHRWRMSAITTGRHFGFRSVRLLLGNWKTTRSTMLYVDLVLILALLWLLDIPS